MPGRQPGYPNPQAFPPSGRRLLGMRPVQFRCGEVRMSESSQSSESQRWRPGDTGPQPGAHGSKGDGPGCARRFSGDIGLSEDCSGGASVRLRIG